MATVDTLVNKLRDLGGSANNPDLKAALGLKDKDWDQLKKGALSSGRVVAGRGFGGRLSLPESVKATTPATNGQSPSASSYGALRGKKLMLVDKEGKAIGKLSTISEFAVTEGMIVAVVE
jgi:hypothetical protein